MVGKTNANSTNNITSKIQSLNGNIIQLLYTDWKASTKYTGYYEQVINVSSITSLSPDWKLFPVNTAIPTITENLAFKCINGLITDTNNLQIIFVAKVAPVTNIDIHVRGVTVGNVYTDVYNGIQQSQLSYLEKILLSINVNINGILLWENEQPADSFYTKSELLSESINNFKEYVILYLEFDDSSNCRSTGRISTKFGTSLVLSDMRLADRNVSFSGKQVIFDDCKLYETYNSNVSEIYNFALIPYKIIGY